jgi:single-strand DNA-binding protein
MNSLNIIGRVGKDAATKTVGQGRLATSWSVAVNVGWGQNEQTLWFDCTMWGERGEKVGARIRKGDQIGVTGSLSTREHDGKTYLKIDVQDVTLIGGKPAEGGDRPQRKTGSTAKQYRDAKDGGKAPPAMDDFQEDSIPF